MSIASLGAAAAYQRTAASQPSVLPNNAGSATSFGDALQGALQSAVDTGTTADAAASAGLQGQGDLTQIVNSVSQAQLALQTTVAIRDRMVQAYQSIMAMPI